MGTVVLCEGGGSKKRRDCCHGDVCVRVRECVCVCAKGQLESDVWVKNVGVRGQIIYLCIR